MTVELLIYGYNFENDIYTLPSIDYNIPEWGTVQDIIINNVLSYQMDESFSEFFESGELKDYTVVYKIDDKTLFNGFVDNIVTTKKDLTVNCKSYTSLLFNSVLREENYAYVKINEYPVDIVKDILELAGLTMNEASYNLELQREQQVKLQFNCRVLDFKYSEALEQLCKATCGILYIEDNEFYFETYNEDSSLVSIPIDENDWVDYPIITTTSAFGSQFKEYDVIYGNNISLLGSSDNSNTINIDIGQIVYTVNGTTAKLIKDKYDAIGSNKKYILNGALKKTIGDDLINNTSIIEWDGRKYEMININNSNRIKTEIECESVGGRV